MTCIKSPLVALSLVCLFIANCLSAKIPGHKAKADDEVTTTLTAGSKDAIFSSRASYTFNVKNATDAAQTGTVSYIAVTPAGVTVAKETRKIILSKHSSSSYDFTVPAQKPGFYKINFMVNVSDYDDTTRRVFGIRPDEIQSQHGRPADFDSFWQNTKAELAAVKPNFKMTEQTDQETENRKVYLVEMRSLDNITVRGWLTIPKTTIKNKKFTTFLALPGYQVDLKPMLGQDDDIAIMALNVRGQGNSRDVIHPKRLDYISLNVEDKNKYVLRGAIMDCIRAIDFIYSRPELDPKRIEVSGGSMGGFLAAAVAGLDSRAQLISSQNPILSDIRNLTDQDDWPMYDLRKYAGEKGIKFDQVLDNLDYFDIKNFAQNIKTPILLGIGLLDHLAPPNNEYAFYNLIAKKYRDIMVFKDLGHEVPMTYVLEEGHRMRDKFGLF
ncbi:acetylxylan esterase [Mucilaginibacter dorajii]|uniref:Acetyl xylan esterase domain-containing protein n=1 Tax=Mucilaginibacter dorajii TaxID=692994 RepID=A0ABP7PYR2_9SPHI|nr:acetylxylan esterase [Mucilaginibacter dorajii]MCS3736393.1 cephalosporin-C deacetylase-like acetyl esterase [Mucilaginibacter dorajii]